MAAKALKSSSSGNKPSSGSQPGDFRLCDFSLDGDWAIEDLSQSGVHRDELVAQALQMARRSGLPTYIYLATQFTRPTFLITSQPEKIFPSPEQVMALHPDGRVLLYIRREILGKLAV